MRRDGSLDAFLRQRFAERRAAAEKAARDAASDGADSFPFICLAAPGDAASRGVTVAGPQTGAGSSEVEFCATHGQALGGADQGVAGVHRETLSVLQGHSAAGGFPDAEILVRETENGS